MARQLVLFNNLADGRRQRNFRRRQDPYETFSDEEIRQRYRFTKSSIDYITDLVKDDIESATRRNYAFSARLKVMMALRFYASGSIQRVVGDTIGADQATVCRAVHDVTEALVQHIDTFIRMPTGDRLMEIQRSFQNITGIPGIVGCIDGTQIPCEAPKEIEFEFVNRKNRHAINVQAVCDCDGLIINIDANWPGSVHDSRIFTESAVGQKLADGRLLGILLGDSGYPAKPYLLTPYGNPVTPEQIRYNKVQMAARSCVERLFGRWKRRFMCLHSGLRCRKPQFTCKVIGACAILHNIAVMLKENDNFDEEIPAEDDGDQHVVGGNLQIEGKLFRDRIAQLYCSQ